MTGFGGRRGICPECRAEIDPRARRCRYCGSKVSRWDVTAVLGAVFALGIGAYACSHVGSSGPGNSQTATDDQTWLEQHKDDPKGLDDRFGDHAEAACSTGADDYLRSIATNDFAWDDDTKGLLGTRFSRIMTTSEAPYVLTLVSDSAKLSNGFGAFTHIDLYCSFDAKLGKVRSYSTERPMPTVQGPDQQNEAAREPPAPAVTVQRAVKPTPPASPDPSEDEKALMNQEDALAGQCQTDLTSAGDQACGRSTDLTARLRSLGWCFDGEGVPVADRQWRRCSKADSSLSSADR